MEMIPIHTRIDEISNNKVKEYEWRRAPDQVAFQNINCADERRYFVLQKLPEREWNMNVLFLPNSFPRTKRTPIHLRAVYLFFFLISLV